MKHFIALILIGLLGSTVFAQDGQRIIFKVKSENRFLCQKSTIQIPSLQLQFDEASLQIEKMFPKHRPLQQKSLDNGLTDISTIYSLEVQSEKERVSIINRLRKNPNIEYAELEVENHLTYQPNDTLNYIQWYLDAVRAFDAWNIEQGDTSVFIAITDTGTDIDHPDLVDNLYRNHDDPINGIDDDQDGYVDNYYGWDVGMDDNDVNPDSHAGARHGTNVAGIASASTDNTTGISGCGFNSRIMTVKINNELGQLVGAYTGVVYAADQGAKIINCSWGSYNYSEFGQDIINYAYINRGALVICGAGNGGLRGTPLEGIGIEDRFYPAAYDNAIAVGALDTGDVVKLSSNYGYWLDLFAPGENMWTTDNFGTYGRNGATSMAAPMIAGGAALVLSQNPSFNNKQIEERLVNSGIDIDASNINQYAGKLGAGKVDFLNAVADTNKPGIRFEKINYSNGNNEMILSGDSLIISGEFINYLKNSIAGTATLTELTTSLQNIRNQISLPALNSLESYASDQNPFVFLLDPQVELNRRLEFRLEINAGTYKRVQFFNVIVNSRFLNLSNGTLLVTLGSEGAIGYPDLDNRPLYSGFSYQLPQSHLWESSFMIGNSSNYVADAFRDNTDADDDFFSTSIMSRRSDARAFAAASGSFDDRKLSGNPRLQIIQNNYLYDSTYNTNVLIFNYEVKNVSGAAIDNIYAGIIADFDVFDWRKNKVFFDSSRHMGVSFSTDTPIFLGMSVLSHPNLTHHYAIDNVQGGEGGVDLSSGFTTAEKFQVLSTNRDSAGWHDNQGEDILDAISIGPFDLGIDSSISLSFAWLAGSSPSELNEAADSAKSIFEKLPIGIEEKQIKMTLRLFPNPASELINIQWEGSIERNLILQVVDLNGKLVLERNLNNLSSGPQKLSLDVSSLKSGLYLLRIIGDQTNIQNKFVLSTKY